MRRTLALSLLAAVTVAACDRKAEQSPVSAPAAATDGGYLASPVVTAARGQAGGVGLEGRAASGAQVRLASPAGESLEARADDKGVWRIDLPASNAPRIFGLSMNLGERRIQAQGYVLVDGAGRITLLRSGAGGLRLDLAGAPRIATFDYDREGGAVASGLAPAGATVAVRGDGALLGEARTDPQGRFSVAITQPLSPGRHRLLLVGKGFARETDVEVSPAEPLLDGPFRSGRAGGALRADWMTPGGGVQTTLILD